jgi:hypothetical protein
LRKNLKEIRATPLKNLKITSKFLKEILKNSLFELKETAGELIEDSSWFLIGFTHLISSCILTCFPLRNLKNPLGISSRILFEE